MNPTIEKIVNEFCMDTLSHNHRDHETVLVFQANKKLTTEETTFIKQNTALFLNQWQAHHEAITSHFYLALHQFLIVIVDEHKTALSGCSKDALMRHIQTLNATLHINFLDRQTLIFALDNQLELLPISHFEYALTNQHISPNTLFFNNLVHTVAQLKQDWLIPIHKSWLNKKIIPV